jgi:hypothetical protein
MTDPVNFTSLYFFKLPSSLTLCDTSSFLTRSAHASPAAYFKTSQVFPIYFPMCPIFSTI